MICVCLEEFDLNAVEGHENYDYSMLLDRIEAKMNQKNKDQEDQEKTKTDVQIVTRIVSTKTSWFGFEETCQQIKRTTQHVLSFYEAELDIRTNPGQDGNVIFQGKFQNKQISALYRKYVENYVRCTTCRATNTELTKDQATRLNHMKCCECGATRTVEQINKLYHAKTRKDRKKEKGL